VVVVSVELVYSWFSPPWLPSWQRLLSAMLVPKQTRSVERLCDRADLDTSFPTLKRVHQSHARILLEIRFNPPSVLLYFQSFTENLFLSVLFFILWYYFIVFGYKQYTEKCKMGLTSLHDFYGSWHLYICRSLFGHSTFFVASLVFMKGTSCCVKRRNFK